MFSPVESQVFFLSKETPIVSVGLRTAEVSYTNQNKTAWKTEVVLMLGWPLPICIQTFSCVNESFWLAKYFHHSNYVKISYLSPIYMPFKYVFERNPIYILHKRHRHENWESSNRLFTYVLHVCQNRNRFIFKY